MILQHDKTLLTKLFLGLALASLMLSLPTSAQQLNPASVPKFADPLPRVCGLIQTPNCIMLATTSLANNIDRYDVAARQFNQQILPAGFGKTTVWGFGPNTPGTVVCGEGALRIVELQRAGKHSMKADEFLRGTPLSPGAQLS